jgi:hypothetical protein
MDREPVTPSSDQVRAATEGQSTHATEPHARWPLAVALATIISSSVVACDPSRAAAPAATVRLGPPPSSGGTRISGGTNQWCGFKAGRPAIDKVLVIWEENHDYKSIIGSPDATLFNSIATQCGLATDHQAVTHPSLPNYLTSTSGPSYAHDPFREDCSPGGACQVTGPSIFSREVAAGREWRSYEDAMPLPCARNDAGPYAVRHNPAVYYTELQVQCHQWDLPLGNVSTGALAVAVTTGDLPAYAMVTPDLAHDMHDGSVQQASAWLSPWLAAITGGPDYRRGRLAVVIVWDEGSGSGNEPSHVPLLVLSASTPRGTRDTAPLNDLSLLRTTEDLTTTGALLPTEAASSFASAFHLAPG